MNYLSLFSIIGATLDLIGKILVSYTAIAVHNRFWQEHKVDERVFEEMRRERKIGLLGVICMILGFLLQLPTKLHGI